MSLHYVYGFAVNLPEDLIKLFNQFNDFSSDPN